MKKLIIVLLIILIAWFVYLKLPESQEGKHVLHPTEEKVEDFSKDENIFLTNDTTHLLFKGVGITGTLKEYVALMERKGFKTEHYGDQSALLTGDFAGYRDCSIIVYTLDRRDLVNQILVRFPARNTWEKLSSDYFLLKEMLTKKYGKPAQCTEKFIGLVLDSDGSKISDVKGNNCKYRTTYATPRGNIRLSIETEDYKCFVQLWYADRINSNIVRSDAMNDL